MMKIDDSSKKHKLFALLAGVSGHFEITSPEDEGSIQSLQENLASTLPGEDITNIKNSFFSVENSDLFFTDTIAPNLLMRLQDLADRAVKAGASDLRVFVREVPVRNTRIRGSVPPWAGGAAVEKTIGPFLNKDGRKIWFDFFRIEKLIALYIDGQTNPAILFNVSSRNNVPPIIDPLTKYRLLPDSVWVNSQIFSPGAPAGFYTGLKIKQGEITMNASPRIVNGKLIISPNTTVTVNLDLDQPTVTDADPTSPYGVDARNATFDLPKQLTFHFSGSKSTTDAVAGKVHWDLYGQVADFQWNKQIAPDYDAILNRVLIPFICSEKTFSIHNCQSPFTTIAGTAEIQWSAWALPAAQIDVTRPSPAAGIGGIAIQCKKGLTVQWKGLQGGEVSLTNPYVLCDVGRINVTDSQAGNLYCNQEYKLWKDDVNPFGSSIKLQYTNAFPFLYNSFANGNEALLALANTNPLLDRPVTVSGQPLDIHSKDSTLVLAVNKAFKVIYLYDDNILFDNYDPNNPKANLPQPVSLALHNALFKVTPVNGCLLFGELADDMMKVKTGNLFLIFGMYAYLPALPDPYAANLNILKGQFGTAATSVSTDTSGQMIWLWLVCETKWVPAPPDKDNVDVSFHFAPLQSQFQVLSQDIGQPLSNLPFVKLFSLESVEASKKSVAKEASAEFLAEMKPMMSEPGGLPDYQAIWDRYFSFFQNDVFALLDVSSNANQMGVSFRWFGDQRMAMLRTHNVVTADTNATVSQFPLQVKGLDVVTKGLFARAFTVPQISWEPVLNLPNPKVTPIAGDPPVPLNYYPDDGGPTKIMNNSMKFVPIAPIPMSEFLVDAYSTEPDNITSAYFTLPFGLRSLAYLYKTGGQSQKPDIQFNRPSFESDLKGGIQLQLNAGSGFNDQESNMFRGYTLQMNNVLDLNGQKTDASTLGHDVSIIFNNEFFDQTPVPMDPTPDQLDVKRGVPLTRLDLSGYGASIFSKWINKDAQFASTSQAEFNVFVGRCAHEVIQVRSILYPSGAKVVRTIVLFRVSSDYVYRFDSGWIPESDGKFDFRFKYIDKNNKIFSWDDIPGNDNGRLIDFLKKKYSINWVETAQIEKVDNGGTIKVFTNTNSLSLKLNNEKTELNLEIDDGRTDKFSVINETGKLNVYEEKRTAPYNIHPGIVKGLFNIRNIRPATDVQPFLTEMDISDFYEMDKQTHKIIPSSSGTSPVAVNLEPVYFDADVELENVVQGQVDGKVPSKKILGFVQLAPEGIPLTPQAFQELLDYQLGSIGGPVDCIIDIGNNGQKMRLNRIDMNNSTDANMLPEFVVAARGNVVLPKDGSWSMVMHNYATGEVTPLPEGVSVPLIRIGELTLDMKFPDTELLRIANPADLLRQAVNGTINFGFLQSTNTQKVLFLTPAFQKIV